MPTKYNILISYQPRVRNGWQDVFVSGATHTVEAYNSDYYVATMPELQLYATSSTPETALSNVLIMASASAFNPVPLSNMRNW